MNEHLQDVPQHKMIVTGKSKNGNILRVRCKCWAEYRNVSDRYYAYDWLAEVRTLEDALRVWKAHMAQA